MGIYDRDYMREDSAPRPRLGGRSEAPASALAARVLVVLLAVGLAVLALRLPVPIYAKIPILVGSGFLIRYLWELARGLEGHHFLKQGVIAERRGDHSSAAANYERAAACRPRDVYVSLRLLSAYHGSGSAEKARALIEARNGAVFEERHVEEMEHLVSKHRPVTFCKTDAGFRMELVDENS